MKNFIRSIVLVGLVAFVYMFIFYESRAVEVEEITLPIAGTRWVSVNDMGIEVLELEHGWLVWRQELYAGGLAYIPKPPYGR